MFGAVTAILSNVENKNYTEKVLLKNDFLEVFRSATKKEMNATENLIRLNPRQSVIAKYKERKPVLDSLVKILKIHEELPAKELKVYFDRSKYTNMVTRYTEQCPVRKNIL